MRRSILRKTKKYDYDVILIAGQSNSDGRVNISNSETPIYLSSNILKDQGLNEINSFNGSSITNFNFSIDGQNGNGKDWVQEDAVAQWGQNHVAVSLIQGDNNRNILICQCTQGYTQLSPLPVQNNNIGSWSTETQNIAGFDMFSALKGKYNNLKNYLRSQGLTHRVTALLWHQGENDYLVSTNTNLTLAERESALNNYKNSFETLVFEVRNFTNTPNLPVIYGTVSSNSNWYSSEIRNAQIGASNDDENLYCRDNDDLILYDGLHFDASSNIIFGNWIKEKYNLIYN